MDAINIFLDPNRVERGDPRPYTETRIQGIGLVNDVVLFGVYTEREGRYRIISATRASRDERRRYPDLEAEDIHACLEYAAFLADEEVRSFADTKLCSFWRMRWLITLNRCF